MTTEVKDFAYYQDHPAEIGNLSDAELDALAQGDTAEAKAETEIEQAPALDAEVAKPEGVATKDGKHVIPFDVLEKERSRVSELERIANEQAAQIEAFKAQTAADPNKPLQSEGDTATQLTEEQLVELEAELPTIGVLLRSQQEQLKAFGDVVGKLNTERQAREQEAAKSVNDTVQAAIDANPKLTYMQSQGEAAWDRAVQLDSFLKADPEWANKTFDERFAKVVELYEATYGEVKLPGQETKSLSQAELAKIAEEKLKSIKPKSPVSISDIPGGVSPAVDEVVAAMTGKSGAELTADFMRMTPAQIDAALARL